MSDEIDRGHWVGEVPDPNRYFGFLYEITHVPSGRRYIGKKQYYSAKSPPGCSRRCADRGSKEWKDKCWGPSNWRTYRGSSPSLKKFMEATNDDSQFKYEILCQCRSKAILHYLELKMLWEADVMRKCMPDGVTYKYFNNSIGSIKFKIKEDIS